MSSSADGHYSSLSAVDKRGLELMLSEAEREEIEPAALRAFFELRAKGPFVSIEEGRRRTEAMIEKKRRSLGL